MAPGTITMVCIQSTNMFQTDRHKIALPQSLSSFIFLGLCLHFQSMKVVCPLCDIEYKETLVLYAHTFTQMHNFLILYYCCCSTATSYGQCCTYFLSLLLTLHLSLFFSSRFLPFLWLMSQQKVTLWSVNPETPKLTNWSMRDSLVWHMGRLVRHILTHKGKSVLTKNKESSIVASLLFYCEILSQVKWFKCS